MLLIKEKWLRDFQVKPYLSALIRQRNLTNVILKGSGCAHDTFTGIALDKFNPRCRVRILLKFNATVVGPTTHRDSDIITPLFRLINFGI